MVWPQNGRFVSNVYVVIDYKTFFKLAIAIFLVLLAKEVMFIIEIIRLK